jgi:Spy/CpxP family protein refolding chaperone
VISRILLTLVVATGAGGAPAFAQEQPPAGKDERPGREEAFRMVDAYVVSNMQESLGLTDEQFAKAIPLVKKLQGERREYLLERTRTVREMRRLLRQGGATEAQVLDLLKRLKALDAEGPPRTAKNLETLDAMLTPLQQAKYRVLEAEVEQRMRELMGRARPQAAPRQGQRSPGE